MTMPYITDRSRTVFDTDAWLAAWDGNTVERREPTGHPLLQRLEYSPFWHGYELDTDLGRIWDRPVLTVSSLYAGYGPAYLAGRPEDVERLMDHASGLLPGTCGLLVLNLPLEAALEWATVAQPDGMIRLDHAYHRVIGTGPEPDLRDVHKRTEFRRRWRRSAEKGLRLVMESDPAPERVEEVVELANGSAERHDWPVLYDRAGFLAVAGMPGGRLVRAEWDGRTVAAFVGMEHDRRFYLWAGGMDHTVVQEVSPYLFTLYELLRLGLERGWDRLELGKGNDAFKRRYGFTGVELWSLWYAADPSDVPAYRPKLAALHRRLGAAQGA
ncbi:GNAT family N-acetyltransferase [Nonomuraea sp. MCN248]|uniref:GNAT family N-acetyltransferase n=1 Tax=Nonomuraea corallina TaxID=2989783 RepID=A0ABT4S6X6_9ACTN|nr:GNAT family N-acetyltransferase [Nonomuraea corallina]MDA0632750.1 GNAT family N-acetyltransferase [Nonomuraea corallina]